MFKEKSEQMYPIMGGKKRLGGIKVAKFSRKNQNVRLHQERMDVTKRIFRWYICSLLYYI